ncbi:hypothetical protein ACFO6R_13715 [Eubacterium multiforme]|uniref:Uncharacterized protein n=1 Tax=Eubacterium multiforme TaxID=83339 RepID=A0ABT9UXU9_9FIRM|nr:hypothetical protein [Eubacterium multiforme]MDQ0151140.1 hypothetical protein [Eubacterium multiforme]
MLKKKISQIMAATMILGVVSGIAPATNASAAEKTTKTSVEQKASPKLDEETMTQLGYAIEEMRIASDILSKGTNLKPQDVRRMRVFASTSIDRVRGLNIDSSNENYGHVQSLEQHYKRIFNVLVSIDNYVLEQLTYAVEEMRIAVNELNAGSKDYDRVLTFAVTALERIRPLGLDSESQHYNHYNWVVNSYDYVVNKIAQTPAPLK